MVGYMPEKTCYNISFTKVSGELPAVTPEITASRTETSLPKILSRFHLKDIYKVDESGLLQQGLIKKTLHPKRRKMY